MSRFLDVRLHMSISRRALYGSLAKARSGLSFAGRRQGSAVLRHADHDRKRLRQICECLRQRSISIGVRPPPRTGDALRGPMDMPPEELIDQVAKDVSGHSAAAERHASDIMSVDPGEVTHDLAREPVTEDKPRVPFVGDASVAFDDRPVRCQKLCRTIKMQQFVLGPAALVTRHSGQRPCASSH